jgi:hypothetical protein
MRRLAGNFRDQRRDLCYGPSSEAPDSQCSLSSHNPKIPRIEYEVGLRFVVTACQFVQREHGLPMQAVRQYRDAQMVACSVKQPQFTYRPHFHRGAFPTLFEFISVHKMLMFPRGKA